MKMQTRHHAVSLSKPGSQGQGMWAVVNSYDVKCLPNYENCNRSDIHPE